MFEWIEKLFASLIVLVMLFILLLVAFPDRLSNIFGPARENTAERQDQDLTGPTALPKGDVKPQKMVGRLADSSDNQKALYRYLYRNTPPPSEARAEQRGYVMTRRAVYRKPEYPTYYTRRYEYEPRYSSAPEGCTLGSCLCNCKKPYWASADWYDDAECWSD